MRTRILALALATMPLVSFASAAPAVAQSRADEDRFQAASQRFDAEVANFQRERDRYIASRSRGSYRDDRYNGPPPSGYNGPPPQQGGYSDYATDYDATRYYRDDPRYQERRLGPNDRVYRGSDGRYYCQRSDGTTGLIIGAGAGALLGNVADGGHNRVAGTLIGGTLGALLGRSIDQNNADVRCR
jgi:hypothetical protein